MIREAFKLGADPAYGDRVPPAIVKVDVTDPDGLSWREAKKQLRQWYLDQAAALRQVTQQTYFGEQS